MSYWIIALLSGLACLLVVVAAVLIGVFLVANRQRKDTSDQEEGSSAPIPVRPVSVERAERTLPAQKRVCSECGTAFSGDVTDGLCPGCRLQRRLSQVHEEKTDQAGEATSPFHPRFTAPEIAVLAPHFADLEIVELVGQGGMGMVYKARQTRLDRMVALKILPREVSQDSAFAERFSREAKALARLSHSHIVTVHDFGESDGLFYFVMEFVDGANLRQLLRTGRISPSEAIRIVRQTCEALDFAHGEAIIHRDIKPENILLDRKGRVKIADFGLAKLLVRGPGEFTLTASQQVMGTLNYMAPEQIEKAADVDHRADIYSLGVVLYELLTGELPLGRFDAPSEKAQVGKQLDDIVMRALAKAPDRRFQRISQLSAELDAAVQTLLGPVAQPAPVFALAGADQPTAIERSRQNSRVTVNRAMVRTRVKAPATGLLITGILYVLFPVLTIFVAMVMGRMPVPVPDFASGRQSIGPSTATVAANSLATLSLTSSHNRSIRSSASPSTVKHLMGQQTAFFRLGPSEIVLALFNLVIGSLVIVGALKMLNLEAYGMAVTSTILVMLPCNPVWLLGLPMGIWGLVVLLKADVKAEFQRQLVEKSDARDQ